MTTDEQELKTPAEYFELGGVWLDAAEQIPVGNGDTATLALLAIAAALLGLCAQAIVEQPPD